jgi:hypothetical protein
MNERIKQLMEQAEDPDHGFVIPEKFAELIIQECAKSLWTEECHTSDLALEEFERNSAKIKEHFGVEK